MLMHPVLLTGISERMKVLGIRYTVQVNNDKTFI